MRTILWDADAFNCARKLGLVGLMSRNREAISSFRMTGYVARHELNLIRSDIERLVQTGLLIIEDVRAGTPAHRRFKKLKSMPKVHKGEAEAIAWAMELPRDERPLFISNDRMARRIAMQEGVPAGDLMDLAVELVTGGIADRTQLEERLAIWDDRSQELCRPKDYQGFDRTFEARQVRRT